MKTQSMAPPIYLFHFLSNQRAGKNLIFLLYFRLQIDTSTHGWLGEKFFFEDTLFPPAEILVLWNYRNKWSFQSSKLLHGFIRCIYFIRENRHQLLQIGCLSPQNMSQLRARHLQLSTAQSWSKHKRNLR